jgi:DNA-binding CsgD family transcriptional regulator
MEASPLVGRADAVAMVERALTSLARGRPPLLRLAGEPGIGKSRMLYELTARADAQGMLVLEGRAAEFEDDLPFGPVVDALDDYLTAIGPRAFRHLGSQTLGPLAATLPALEGVVEAPAAPAAAEERYRSHRAVRRLLAELARPRPLVLALDDVHWADAASTELLIHLARHPPPGRVMIALTHRSAALDPRLAEALDRGGRVWSIELGPLSRPDAEALIGERLPPLERAELYEESGGNPFYLRELVRASEGGAGHERRGGARTELPAAVAAAIEHEVASLPAAERALAQGAAVTGQPFDMALAAIAAGIPESRALALLDRLVAAGLVHTTDVPRRLAFRHPVVRRAVYETAGPGWRLAAHRRLAAALRERGASAIELARHVEAAAEPGDESATAVLAEAGAAVAPRAPAIAARHLEAALRLTPVERASQRLSLLMPLAASRAAAADLAGAHAALTEALDQLPPGSGPVEVQLVAQCAALEHLLGRHDDARGRLLRALEALPSRRSAEGVALLAELAVAAIWAADFEQVTRLTSEARTLATGLDAPTLHVQVEALAAFGALSQAPSAEAAARLDGGVRLADALDDAALAARLDALYYLAFAAFFRERHADCVRLAERALRLSRESAQGHLLVHLTVAQAAGLMRLGRIPEALDAAEDALDAARLAGNDLAVVWAGWVRCLTALHVDVDLAVAAGEEVLARAAGVPSPLVSGGAGWILGLALVEAGDPSRARRLVLEAVGGPEFPVVAWSMRCLVYELLTRAELAIGRLDRAERWVARAEATAAPLGLGVASAQAGRARAEVALARGNAGEAAYAALTAADAADRQGAPVEAARARTLAGRALAAGGDRERAAAQLERSLAIHESCGATRYAQEATRELRRLGRRIGRGGRRGVGTVGIEALSGRQLEIAVLVAEGLTNREIGDRLFLSEKTVETHLSHVFRKLGVSSRAAVAREVGRGPRATRHDRDFPDVRPAAARDDHPRRGMPWGP